ncbi:Small ribosomal subunit biogenesis [Tieghemiomyces parasiticus]|uniref:Small ribosomal subunit biogenesis n=1 Tax=Tieghemiomyces parasiticus TaxID=78921 RepID=A0A9W8AMA3_9FUNG|nr:Small ribosomal subunit biogenesis [Tieghemiomyces parasiticus]
MVLQVSNANNVRVYTVCGAGATKKIPEWLAARRKKKLRSDVNFNTRIELIQDFEFPSSSLRVKVTPDGKHCMATGVYKPRIRCYDFAELSLKFERYTNSENVNFLFLSDDWSKSVHLQNDRYLEFHVLGEVHYRTRIPAFGRDLAYHAPSSELLVTSAQAEVYRLNLDEGRFMQPLVTGSSSGVNVVDINPAHQLFGFGTQDGTVEFWDPRARERIGTVHPALMHSAHETALTGFETTALKFHSDGLSVAVGTSVGQVLLYDLRNATPYLTKDHHYGLPIKSLHWHTSAADTADRQHRVISADARVIRIWDRLTGQQMTSVEPKMRLNDVCVLSDSGMILGANEGAEVLGYYIPALGPAPRWCSFLDNLTEEMEEKPQQNVYDDYRFVTAKELATLGLEHLIGTNLLRSYMHGFFIDLRLYEKAKVIANPFAYDEYREKQLREVLEKERGSRIGAKASRTERKVNRELAERASRNEGLYQVAGRASKQQAKSRKATKEDEDEGDSDGDDMATRALRRSRGDDSGKAQAAAAAAAAPADLLEDNRFAAMFEDSDFEVDEEASEFQQLRRSEAALGRKKAGTFFKKQRSGE